MEQYKNIPESLKQLNQWVCFKLELNEKKGKADKIPKDPRTGYNAKANDPTTWSDYQTAVKAVSKYSFDGIGIEFANGVFGVDLDNVIEGGKLTAEAQDIIKTLDSYTEYSPSKTGVHILCKGSIPAKDRRKGNIEMYSEGRFFTVTGLTVGTPKDIQERTAQAAAVHAKYLKREEAPKTANQPQDLTLSDRELIDKAMSARNGSSFRALWSGDISGYPSASEADLALCNLLAYWTNGNAYRMDVLFRQSALYRESKWNKRHGADTYGNITINKALRDFTPYEKTAPGTSLTPGREQPEQTIEDAVEGIKDDPAEREKEIAEYKKNNAYNHIADFLEGIRIDTPAIPTGFKELDNVLDGGLYEGLYILGAISSLGKTTLVLQIADQIAQQGHDVLIFSLEMARYELMAKSISRITFLKCNGKPSNAKTTRGITARQRHEGYSPEERKLINESIEQYGEYAKNLYISEGIGNIGAEEIGEAVRKHISITGKKPVVVIDYLQILKAADPRSTDKQNTDKAVFMLKRISREYKIPIIGISSLNRDNYKQKINMAAFKESGAIEYSSDVLIGLQFQEVNDKEISEELLDKEKRKDTRKIELKILKNRNGQTGDQIDYDFISMFNYFRETGTNKETNGRGRGK